MEAATPAPERDAAPTKRMNPMRLRQLKDRADALEEEIVRLETEIAGYEASLADFKNADETIRLSALLDARRSELESAMGEWEEISTLIEANQ